MATRVPAPVDTGVTPVVTRPIDRAPVPVPAGPGTTGQIPTVKKPAGPPEAAPPAVTPSAGITVPPVATPQGPPETVPPAVPPGPATGQSAGANVTPTVPVQELPVDTPNVDAGTTIIPNINYIQVLANGTVVVARTTAMNFAGTGVTVTGSNGTATITVVGSSYGNSNVVTLLSSFGSNTVSTTGNVTAGYVFGNGSQLTGIVSSYGNANVVANLAALGSNPVSTTGNVTASYVFGNGSQLTGLPATYGNANVVANLAALGSNPVSTTGNVTASYVFGNGSQLTGLPATYGNANVVANLAALGTNPISTTGNITGNNFVGNIQGTTGDILNVTSTNLTVTNISAPNPGNAVNIGAGGNNNLVVSNVLVQVQNVPVSVAGNVTGGNVLTGGLISATGNVTGNYILGNGSQLTGIAASYGNANVATFLAAYGSNTISTSGNVTAGNIIGNINITGNVQGTSSNVTLVAGAYSWTFDNTGNLQSNLSLTGANITINNAPGGPEGAEIKWALPAAANTVLNTSLIQYVFQNGMRFFEAGGNSRGLYMDLGNVPNGAGTAVGYRDIPQVSLAANTTIAATDAGRHYYSVSASNLSLTIANNTSVAWPIGTAISIVNANTGNILINQGVGVSMYLAGNATAGNRVLGTFGMATIMNTAANTWFINGTGLT